MTAPNNTKWTYRSTTRPGDDRTTIQILTVPQGVVRRGLAALGSAYQVLGTILSAVFGCLISRCLFQMPGAPHIQYVPLPGTSYFRPQIPSLFPIDLTHTGVSSAHLASLCEALPAFTTVCVRDGPGRVFCNVQTPSSAMTTADFVEFLQHLVGSALPAYHELSPTARHDVKEHFVVGARRRDAWVRYRHGQSPLSCFPRGHDLFLGHTFLWMLVPEMGGGWSALVHPPPPPRLH
ncbi:hypothetical protein C8R46DRAFT_1123749 [Mycena filopes]|nr:hypothetical protein C8R46DRAFT_1123749 [Mycena filopes]